MDLPNELYSDLRSIAFKKLENGEIPTTLVYMGRSVFCWNVHDALFNKFISRVDELLRKEDRTKYENAEMVRIKSRIHQMLYAMDFPENCNIDLKKFNEEDLAFSNVKLKA